jgi:cytoskeletal protein CcmA (bactofilin family)
MAKLFGAGAAAKPTNSMDTLVGRQTEVLGDVRFSGGLHVDGCIKGKVFSNGDKNASLSVSDVGIIEGDVNVPNVVLNGQINGDVRATSKVTLASKARVTGNVYYRVIQIESGAMVNGQLVCESGDVAGALTHQKDGADELSEARRVKGLSG